MEDDRNPATANPVSRDFSGIHIKYSIHEAICSPRINALAMLFNIDVSRRGIWHNRRWITEDDLTSQGETAYL